MKKLLIALFAAGIVSSANAQGYQKNNKEAIYSRNDNRQEQKNHYNSNLKERDQQISRINRDFDKQIQSLRKNRYMSSSEKNRRISMIERQRDQQVKQCIARYTPARNDNFAKNDRRF